MVNNRVFAGKKMIGYFIWAGILLVLLALAYQFPVVGDDWYTTRVHIGSLKELIENGAKHWNNVNGRWLGHIAVILSMSSKVLCSIIRAFIIWMIMLLAYKNSGLKCKVGYLLVFLCILAVPKEIFSETYSWAAGFFNYVPPVLLILLYLFLIRNEWKQNTGRFGIFKGICAFLIGMCSQLFVENITIYVLLLSIVVSAFYIKKYKKVSFIAFGHTLGAITGTFLMFLSPVYRTVAEGTDTYRTAPQGLGGLLQTVRGNWTEVSRYTVRGNILLLFIVAVVCAYLLYRGSEQSRKINVLRMIDSCILVGTTAYFLSSMFLGWDEKIEAYTAFFVLDVFILLLYVVSVFITILFFVKDREKKAGCLFYLVSAFIQVSPLLAVTPIGPRCFYGSYIFTVVGFLHIIAYMIEQEGWNIDRAFAPFCILAFCVSFYYLYIFSNISDVEQERNAYIIEQMKKGETFIALPEFPYNDYLHDEHTWKIGLNYYYKEEKDIQFEYIPYSEWKAMVS